MRDKPALIREYTCEKPEIKMTEFRKATKMVPLMTQFVTAMRDDDEELKNMLVSLNLFIEHLDELIGVFEPTYNEGEFCAGLIFGSAGSNLL